MAGLGSMPTLEADKHYVLMPSPTKGPEGVETRVLWPFDGHQQAWVAREAWAYCAHDVADGSEILTGQELARDYAGRHGCVAG